ncbi:MAG: GNAT family N-acetyltransferase [Rhodobacteraceae bacterium]|nr:GNAT family N-acetyltransferase [Paracoccaceae bacterium]
MPDGVDLRPLPPLENLARDWQELECRSCGSFFTSWTWIGAWLDTVIQERNAAANLSLLTVRDGKPVAMAILGRRNAWTWPIGREFGAVNQIGDSALDGIWIEYNDLLAATGHEKHSLDALLQYIAADRTPGAVQIPKGVRWAGLSAASVERIRAFDLAFTIRRASKCRWVNLTQDHGDIDLYLSHLSSNSRQQIRRSLRLLFGDKRPRIERTVPETLASDLQKFKQMHVDAWRKRRGHDGAYANPLFETFLHRLISAGIANGSVELLKINSDSTLVGILINFIYRGSVYAYQSAFQYYDDNRIKPGIASHAAAIADFGAKGMEAYRFMDGAGRYKESLGTNQEVLYWVDIAKPTLFTKLTFAIANCLS